MLGNSLKQLAVVLRKGSVFLWSEERQTLTVLQAVLTTSLGTGRPAKVLLYHCQHFCCSQSRQWQLDNQQLLSSRFDAHEKAFGSAEVNSRRQVDVSEDGKVKTGGFGEGLALLKVFRPSVEVTVAIPVLEVNLFSSLFLSTVRRFFEYILLYKDAVMFQIEQVTKLCSKIALTDPWDPYDIPANSTYEDQYYIGGPGDEIMVQEWSDRKPARKLESWVGVYTVKDCYPVQETYTKNYSVTTSTRFFDIHLGIADPSVFTPPSTCQAAQLTRMKEEC
ncbi:hypothetical protein WISP_76044 [Willisornis vidua]|uniref:Mammalian ependymin-related protein 1 n=1 Tax=Willisornis vidua TaxID=1566151 RepID=A0ABQ9D648_9PASS|nr:hypothetical protein WISP_76044 [Willisornis vidua]